MTSDQTKPDGTHACEFLLGLYDKMIMSTYGNAVVLKHLYQMALESEGLEKWPAEYRQRLVWMFEKAIRLAETDGFDGSGSTLH